LFDGSQGFLAGQKRGAHASGSIRSDDTRLLEIHFQNCVPLIKFRRPREVTQRQKKAGQNADGNDPNTLDERMPVAPKIKRL